MNKLPKPLKVILWILFWYYLGPYYLFKKYVFQNNNHKIRWSIISTIVILLFLFTSWVHSFPDNESNSQSEGIHYVTKKVGAKELAKAKLKRKSLLSEEKKKQEEYDKLSAQMSSEKKKENQAQEQVDTPNDTDSYKSKNNEKTKSNKGDINTASTGKIVGNANSKIYHVQGQAGYKMDSANAVYFNSEQEAIAAGYRKAKR